LDMMYPLFGLVEGPRKFVAAEQTCHSPGKCQAVSSPNYSDRSKLGCLSQCETSFLM
jgi:hypothetical protein